jgi:hypothetical protein
VSASVPPDQPAGRGGPSDVGRTCHPLVRHVIAQSRTSVHVAGCSRPGKKNKKSPKRF